MLSLRDKLRMTSPSAAPKKQAAEDCYVRRTEFSPTEFPKMRDVASDTLFMMQGTPEFENKNTIFSPRDILFLDTETTGLSGGAGTLAFLVGVGFFTENAFVVMQYLMRDYDEEVFLLAHIAPLLAKYKLLVTFNGKTFDMPLLESRFTMQRMRDLYSCPPHADLLHTARRVWKLRLKKCTLSALEENIFFAPREDDLPGAQVPERFFGYLKTHQFSLFEDVLKHNCQDIVSLALLLYKMADLHDAPLLENDAEDLYSLGRIFEKRRCTEQSRQCYRAADKGKMSALAQAGLAESYRKEKSYAQAANVYEAMIKKGYGGVSPYISLAKIYEHRLHDNEQAVIIAMQAMSYCAERAAFSSECADALPDIQKRLNRLLQKTRRSVSWDS